MLSLLAMRGSKGFSWLVLVAASAAPLFVASPAVAQTVSYSMQSLPERFLPDGGDLGVSTRQAGQNPEGISFADCDSDQTLSFFMYTTGFASAGASLGVFASVGASCITNADRNGPTFGCWNLGAGLTTVADGSHTINVRVQDLVAYMETTPPQTSNYTPAGSSVCSTAQKSATGEAMTIWFVPLQGTQAVGTGITYPVSVDMLGPPPPSGVSIMDGDTLFIINWTANSDSVTQGYNVYMHALGAADAGAITEGFDADYVCTGEGEGGSDETDTDAESDDGGGLEASDDAGVPDATVGSSDAAASAAAPSGADGTTASGADAATPVADATTAETGASSSSSGGSSGSGSSSGGSTSTPSGDGGVACAYVRQPNGNALCLDNTAHDLTLSGTVYTVASTTASSISDDASDDGGVVPTSGGISAVSSQYLLNAVAGMTVTGESSSTYTATGLNNNTVYAVSVSAVDDFGNIGPPSTPQACDFPAVVNDFWTVYTSDGGHAGGGFCALEAVGAPAGSTVAFGALGAGAIAVIRRRRRRGQS
jgi:hypothetical protein